MLLCLGFMISNPETNLVWIDSEWTGLDIDKCTMLSIAAIVTNDRLEVLAEGPEIVIHQPDSVLAIVDRTDKVVNSFFENGFIDQVRSSTTTMSMAENAVLEFIKGHVKANCAVLCGNSVHMDRMFLRKYMRTLHDFLHYRNLDVTTVKELYSRWRPDLPAYSKGEVHRALDDIRDSISELTFYKSTFFKL